MKLMTKEIEKKFKDYPIGSQEGLLGNAKVIVKYFNPIGAGIWLITEGNKLDNGDYEMFGYCHLGYDDMAEFGYVMLSELESIQLPFGFTIERHSYNDNKIYDVIKSLGITPPDYLNPNYKKDNEKEVNM